MGLASSIKSAVSLGQNVEFSPPHDDDLGSIIIKVEDKMERVRMETAITYKHRSRGEINYHLSRVVKMLSDDLRNFRDTVFDDQPK